ncbi:MAG: hypothetical protein WCV91_01185 [Candidatus Margulisiibacteriota bacterium]
MVVPISPYRSLFFNRAIFGGSPSGKHPSIPLCVGGSPFIASSLLVTMNDFARLGFNINHFKIGLKIYLMKLEVYVPFVYALFGPRGGSTEGIYAPDRQLIESTNRHLANCGRIVVLPEDHNLTTEVHEVLHDILRVMPHDQQVFFTRLALKEYQQANFSESEESDAILQFYNRIAEAYNLKHILSSIGPRSVTWSLTYSPGTVSLGHEFFAFAGELLHPLHDDATVPNEDITKGLKAPPEIRRYFQSKEIFLS